MILREGTGAMGAAPPTPHRQQNTPRRITGRDSLGGVLLAWWWRWSNLHFPASRQYGCWRLSNSPGLFAARVTEILHGLDPEALSYVDDIYRTDDELLQHLRRVARIVVGFAKIGYKFNLKKSKIAFLSVIFLVYELSNEDLLAAKHLHTQDNKTHLVIRVIAGAIGFTYVTFNEGETVPIGYKSHLYSAAEQRFAPTERILTAVQMAVIKERPLAQGKRIIVVSPIPAIEAVTEASVPNAKALHPRWIQWATSLTATNVDYIFDPKLQTQEFLQYEVEYPVPADTLPIDQYQVVMYTDGSEQPPSFNEYLHYWCLNGFRDSKGNTIKHRLLWGKVADLKETLPKVHVVHTLGHQRVGIHVAGNTLGDEAAKSAVAVATVAAVTRSSSRPDTEILAAIKATVDGTPYPKRFSNKYQYFMGSMLNAEVKIPGVGVHVREIPNKVVRPELINAAHEGVASAHAGVAATISLLQARHWWPGLYKETKQYVLCCDICQQIKVSTAKRPPQTPLLISNRPLQCVYLDHCSPLTPDSAYKYILVAVDSCSRFVWVWPQRSADARTVIKDLRVFVGTYAVAAFHSDQGPAFASRAFRDTMDSLGVQLQFSSPFHPEGNSVVELLSRNLKQSLTARVLDGPGVETAETPFDVNDCVTVLQELQQFREDNSSKSAVSTGIKDVPVTPTGWIPRVGELGMKRSQ
ncbi:hypothetical protein NDU88_006313 [Pleurodeles waltl]|uniref:Gypsy retrotransposon integrase-like protein 1 n=1 Tax=Pleurodeles waltl TaxID=8319 RepID=A0AAV7MBV0_PLEWA|nr:hypothetical protein NDU88_006313 [Pleurodeles waltl]